MERLRREAEEAEQEQGYNRMPARYFNRVYQKFRLEAEKGGFTVVDYYDRFFYNGPAVRVRDRAEMQRLIRCVSVELQTEDIGKGLYLYPKE